MEILLKKHEQSKHTDLSLLETTGAINFLKLDDILLANEGELIDPKSIILIETDSNGQAIFPSYDTIATDPFIQAINCSGKKWVILVNKNNNKPLHLLDADQFLRSFLYGETPVNILHYCHRPIVLTDEKLLLGYAILNLKVHAKNTEDDVIDNDVILLWNDTKRIITGADILGRLLRGIVMTVSTK
jgi:metal transporter CNNM